MPTKINYTAMKFHHLILSHKVRAGGKGVGAIWSALCDCGNIVDVVAKDVANGRRKTCGKCKLGQDLRRIGRMRSDRSNKAERLSYSRHFRAAVRRHKKFDLGSSYFLELVRDTCTWCERPAHESKSGLNEVGLIVDSGSFTPENVETICLSCKEFKGKRSAQEFLDLCHRVSRAND